MKNSENLKLAEALKWQIKADRITSRDLDEMEREMSNYASRLYDQSCWALEPSEKSMLTEQLNEVAKNLKAIYAARAELYSNKESKSLRSISHPDYDTEPMERWG
jgi:hypothetical protein